MAYHAPWVLEELVDFFNLLTVSAPGGLPEELVEAVCGWRIVGIPKRNSNESRPIAVASVLVRLWHRVLLRPTVVGEGRCCSNSLLVSQR